MRIDEMSAGREMDCLIAEKLMGITVLNKQYGAMMQIPCPDCRPGCLVFHGKPIPHYSTDIADAWEIITQWNSCGYGTFELNCAKIGNEINWHCQFGNYPPADAETAPLAICRAALKALGVTEC